MIMNKALRLFGVLNSTYTFMIPLKPKLVVKKQRAYQKVILTQTFS